MEDELSNYLSALERASCYRVDATLKEGRLETTERVFFVGENGAELGPFVRKLIATEAGIGGAYQELFEAQRRGVRLPHLPRLLECSRQGDRLVVVMEHVGGETLETAVRGLCSPAARLDLVRRAFPELCDAVCELHERLSPPIIHRDLKPGNVMVGPSGVTLIDLGIARTYKEGAQQDTAHFGTRAYAPPEQFGFGQTGVTSDVYALGMLLFFCLTGREPTARDREEGFAGTGVPEPLRAVMARATRLDPAERFPSVRELGAALLEALAQVPCERPAPPVPSDPPVLEWPREPRAARARLGGVRRAVSVLLGRVPGWVGVVWNAVVLLVGALLVAGCLWAVANPTPENARWPTWYLAFSYLGFLAPAFLVGVYLLLDRRPLRRRVPALAGVTVARETGVGLRVMLGLLALWACVSVVALA